MSDGPTQNNATAPTEEVTPEQTNESPNTLVDTLSTPPGEEDKERPPEEADAQNDKSKEEAPEKEGPPESYEFTAPEGMEVDSDALSSYEKLARDNGLSQEQFSAITQHGLDYFQKELGKLSEAHSAREQGWRKDALSDKDLSDGQALKPEVMTNVGHVFDQFGGKDLRLALAETGAGNHPQIIRAFNAIGKALGAAQTPDKGKPASELKGNSFEDIARRRYGSNS